MANTTVLIRYRAQEKHRHPGIFVARGKEDLLITRNLIPGDSVYGEKRISIDSSPATGENNSFIPEGGENGAAAADAGKVEYRVWNPFRSKLAAGVLGGLDNLHMRPGGKVCLLSPSPLCTS